MAELPLRFIPIGAFLGDFEGGASLAISRVFSSAGSYNMWIDKQARATKILGYIIKNNGTSAPPDPSGIITSNIGGNAERLRHIHHHVAQAGRTVTRSELGIFENDDLNWELRVSPNLGLVWRLIRDFGFGCVGQIPSFAQSGDALFMANGVTAVQRINVAGESTADAGQTQAAAPLVVDAGVGLLTGTKRYKIVALDAGGARLTGSFASARTTFAAPGRKATITWAAVVNAATYEIYSTPGSGSLFFLEGTVVAPTLTFASNIADVDLIQNRLLQEHGDPPPVATRFLCLHKQRMLFLGTAQYPRRIWYADAGLPDSVYQDTNYLDLTDADNWSDEIVGATAGFKGLAIVWMGRSIWAISGTFTTSGAIVDIARRRTSSSTGAVHIRAVAKVPKGAVWLDERGTPHQTTEATLAYLSELGDLRLFDGEYDTIIGSAKADAFSAMTYDARRKSYVVEDTPRGELTWVFPADGNNECSAAVTWNYQFGTMVDRPAWRGLAHAIQIEAPQTPSLLLAGEADLAIGGYCYELWSGSAVINRSPNLPAALAIKTLYGAALPNEDEAQFMSYVKRWRWIDMLIDCSGDEPLRFLVDCWPDDADPDETPYARVYANLPTDIVLSSEGEQVESLGGHTLATRVVASNARGVVLRAKFRQFTAATGQMRYLHSRGIRIRIQQQGLAIRDQWSLIGANVAFQVLPGLQRVYRRPFQFRTPDTTP